MTVQRTQDLRQLGGAELARSTGAVTEAGETDGFHLRDGTAGPASWGRAATSLSLPLPPNEVPVMNDDSTFLTPEAYQKLKDELEHLTTTGRAEIEQRIQSAREHGDLRENADYDVAKHDQGLMEARIRQVQALLDKAEVREVEDTDTVVVGSVVTVVDADGDEDDYFVAPPENRQAGMLLASPSGPLGQALLGSKPGDEVSYQAPGGTFTVTVKAVRPFRG